MTDVFGYNFAVLTDSVESKLISNNLQEDMCRKFITAQENGQVIKTVINDEMKDVYELAHMGPMTEEASKISAITENKKTKMFGVMLPCLDLHTITRLAIKYKFLIIEHNFSSVIVDKYAKYNFLSIDINADVNLQNNQQGSELNSNVKHYLVGNIQSIFV